MCYSISKIDKKIIFMATAVAMQFIVILFIKGETLIENFVLYS